MKRLLLTFALLALTTIPASAVEGPVGCTADLKSALEAQGLTCTTGEAVFLVRIHATDTLTTKQSVQLLVDAYASRGNYQQVVPCEETRRVDDAGVLVQAGPGDAGCDAGLVGQQIANPQSKDDVAKILMRGLIIENAVRRQRQLHAEEAQAKPVDEPGVRGGSPR